MRMKNENKIKHSERRTCDPKTLEPSGFRTCDTSMGNACFATGSAGFVMASVAAKMIATGTILMRL